jgi:hypothetical protein
MKHVLIYDCLIRSDVYCMYIFNICIEIKKIITYCIIFMLKFHKPNFEKLFWSVMILNILSKVKMFSTSLVTLLEVTRRGFDFII